MDITLAEAWTLWWSGQQLTDHTIHGMSVLWASRTGKTLAFLAGCTIVLDIIGSERLIEWGLRIQASKGRWAMWSTVLVLLLSLLAVIPLMLGEDWGLEGLASFAAFLASMLALGASLLSLGFVAQQTPRAIVWFGRQLARPRFELWLRMIAVPLFFVGFALDYLAS